MKRKNAFWLSLVFAITFACAPMLAQAAPQDTPPPNGAPPAPPQATQPAPSPTTHDEREAQRTISGPYRLTYILTEMDGTKRLGSQRYAIVLDADALHSHLKLDSTIPVHFGSSTSPTYEREPASVVIDTTLRQRANGLELITSIMQTAFGKDTGHEQTTGDTPPVTRDFVLTTTALVIENKPITIAQLDVPGTLHGLQVEVELTRVR